MDCLFCKIISKQIPAQIIYEDDHALAFLDNNPIAPGHTIILPKVHAYDLLELPEEEVAPLFSAVKKVTAMLDGAFGKTGALAPYRPEGSGAGFTIGINNGRVSGQAIDHLHVHIIPRFEGDGGWSIHSIVNNPPKESLEEIKDKILSH